jgi:hypothetical protein
LKGFIEQNLVVNMWQVILSIVYVAHNAILSTLWTAKEWTGYAKRQKALRVSRPTGGQRSTYFISMPLRYSLPLMGILATMHWLLSQSTFIIRISTLTYKGEPVEGWTLAGYSSAASLLGNPSSVGNFDIEPLLTEHI